MSKKQLQIKDSQVKKNLRWHILRLLRLNSRTRQELIDKLSDMYLGYWQVNNELIARNLSQLESEGLISCGHNYNYDYEITERGLEDLVETVGGKLKLTQRGEEELKSEAISPSLPSYIHRTRFWRYIKYNFCLFKRRIYTDLHGFTGYKL
jgi:DNA-binding PadR family transcriptional regulator